jgi:hypothetical protein
MKTYTIKWDEISDLWFLNEVPKRFLGEHLFEIMNSNKIHGQPYTSESHMMYILASNNIRINLEDFSGNGLYF